MKTNGTRAWVLALSGMFTMTTAWGCQLVAEVDRSQIPDDEVDPGADAGGGDSGSDDASDGSDGSDGPDGDVACTTPSDCPGTDDECQERTCDDGVCGTSFTAEGTPVTAQTLGDCLQIVCDGNGATKTIAFDTDLPDDDNPCTDDVCDGGVASHPAVAPGLACGTNLMCDGNGACVGCVSPSDCPGTDDECQQRKCDNGTCGFTFAVEGTPISGQQVMGDCKIDVCNGAGQLKTIADDSDVPDDENPCTTEACASGNLSVTPVAPGVACGTDLVCDGQGACVGCVTADDCPGVDDECQTRTCEAGTCGFVFAPWGTELAGQTLHDCKKNVCDGTGGTTVADDDADVPEDDGNPCTEAVCTEGAGSHAPTTDGTACDDGNPLTMNDVCTAGVCAGVNLCAGVVCTPQDQCRDAGTCDPATGQCSNPAKANGSACNDGNACTQTDTCQNGVCVGANPVVCTAADQCHVPGTCDWMTGQCSNPPAAEGTSCDEGGGTVCDGSGSCIAP